MAKENKVLDAYSILYKVTEQALQDFEGDLYHNDDGQETTAKEARRTIIDETTKLIKKLEQLRMEATSLTWDQFKQRHHH